MLPNPIFPCNARVSINSKCLVLCNLGGVTKRSNKNPESFRTTVPQTMCEITSKTIVDSNSFQVHRPRCTVLLYFCVVPVELWQKVHISTPSSAACNVLLLSLRAVVGSVWNCGSSFAYRWKHMQYVTLFSPNFELNTFFDHEILLLW